MASKHAAFQWDDPLLLDQQLTDDREKVQDLREQSLLDGDLPKRDWFDAPRTPLLSDSDGEIHTVVPGRPIVLTERGDTVTENALMAAVAELPIHSQRAVRADLVPARVAANTCQKRHQTSNRSLVLADTPELTFAPRGDAQ